MKKEELKKEFESGTVTITKDNIHLYYEFMSDEDKVKNYANCSHTPSELIEKLNLNDICIVVFEDHNNTKIKELIKENIYWNDEISKYDNNYYISDIAHSLIENKDDVTSSGYFWEINVLKQIISSSEYKEYIESKGV